MSFPSPRSCSARGLLPTSALQIPSRARPTCPDNHRGQHTEPPLGAHPCPPGTQAAWPTGRSTLKAAAGRLRTAPAPPACVTRASSPVPASSVSSPVPIPTRGPVTAALDALVRGARGGPGWQGGRAWSASPALAPGGTAETGFSRSGPHACTHPNPGGWGPWETETPPTPGTVASMKARWSHSALTPRPDCEHEGRKYEPGESFQPGEDPCEVCTCEVGEAPLRAGRCAQLAPRGPEAGEGAAARR